MSRVIRGTDKITYPYIKHTGWSRGVDVINKDSHVDYITAHSDGEVVKVVDYLNGTKQKEDRDGMGYGNYVMILHNDYYVTLYAHLATVNVREGARVKRGDIIGYMGETGKANGVHLHFEVRKYYADLAYDDLHNRDRYNWIDSTPYLDKDLPVTAWVENYEPYHYRVRKTWEDVKSQIGAFHSLSKAIAFANENPGYKVFNESGVAYEPIIEDYPEYSKNTNDFYRVRISWRDYKSQIGAYKRYEGAVGKAKENPGYCVFDKNGNLVYKPEFSYGDYAPGSSYYYRIRKNKNDAKSQIGAFKSYEKAVAFANENPGYHVYDKDGNEIY